MLRRSGLRFRSRRLHCMTLPVLIKLQQPLRRNHYRFFDFGVCCALARIFLTEDHGPERRVGWAEVTHDVRSTSRSGRGGRQLSRRYTGSEQED